MTARLTRTKLDEMIRKKSRREGIFKADGAAFYKGATALYTCGVYIWKLLRMLIRGTKQVLVSKHKVDW